MKCQRCQSERVIQVTGKCSDLCGVSLKDSTLEGYVPGDLGIGGGDYIEFNSCLECGQLQGKFPLPPSEIEKEIPDEEVVEFFDNHFTEGKSIDSLPRRYQHDLIKSATDMCPTFGSFMTEFFQFNTGLGLGSDGHKFPSCTKFVQMYRSKVSTIESE